LALYKSLTYLLTYLLNTRPHSLMTAQRDNDIAIPSVRPSVRLSVTRRMVLCEKDYTLR